MELPYLFFDSEVLRNFADANMLILCHSFCESAKFAPHWTQETYTILQEKKTRWNGRTKVIHNAEWLGEPMSPTMEDFEDLVALQVGLNDHQRPAWRNYQHAEILLMAKKHLATIATDCPVVFDQTRNRFGSGQAIDTVQILQEAVRMRLIGPSRAAVTVTRIRANGGQLRHPRPHELNTAFFER